MGLSHLSTGLIKKTVVLFHEIYPLSSKNVIFALLQACVLPTPKGKSFANYARCVNQILHGTLSNVQVDFPFSLQSLSFGILRFP